MIKSSGTTHSPGANCNDARGTRPEPLQIEPATGLLAGVRQVLSPHFDARPKGVAPELIVVHGISLPAGEFGGPWIDHLFAGDLRPTRTPLLREHAGLRVSAHAVIRRDGSITQYVPFGMRAWHAGVSEYQGRSGCNDFSIGIELEGTDAVAYTDAQYESLGGSRQGAALHLPDTLRRTHRRPQRHRPRPQNRPRAVVRLAALAEHIGSGRSSWRSLPEGAPGIVSRRGDNLKQENSHEELGWVLQLS